MLNLSLEEVKQHLTRESEKTIVPRPKWWGGGMNPTRLLFVTLLCPLLFAALPHEAAAQIPTVRVFADACMITEGETVTYTFTADPAPTADMQVDFGVAIPGPASGIAFPGDLGNKKSVTISANQTTATYVVRTRSFDVLEDINVLEMHLHDMEDRVTNPYRTGGGTFGRWSTVTIILDTDIDFPVATFACLWTIVPEDVGVQNVEVKLSSPAPSSGVAVNYSVGGTATSGEDFVALSGSIQAPAGAKSVDIPVSIIHDALDEPQETVILTLTGVLGYTTSRTEDTRPVHTIYIEDVEEPPPPPPAVVRFAEALSWAAEGVGVKNVRLNLSPAPSSGIAVKYSVGSQSTATSGEDFEALSGSVQAAAGATSVDIPVSIIDDELDERTEDLFLRLTPHADYETDSSTNNHRLKVTDNDTPEASFAGVSSHAAEDAGVQNVRVNLSPAPWWAVKVKYSVGGTATSGDDFTALSGSVQAAPGATSVDIPVTIINDTLYEGAETVVLTLKPALGYAVGAQKVHTLTITDNDTPEISITGGSAVTEGEHASFTLKASPAPFADLSVKVTVTESGSFASSGAIGVRTVTVGASGTATFTVSTTDDSVDEANGSVTATVGGGSGYVVARSPANSATVAVEDNDTPEAIFVEGSSGAAEDAGVWNVTINLSPAPHAPLSLAYLVGGTATSGDDFEALAGSVQAAAGATSVNIPVPILDDTLDERDETVMLTLKPAAGYAVGAQKVHTLTITDNDTPEISITGGPVVTEGEDASFTLTASPAPFEDVSVKVTVAENGSFAIQGETGVRQVTVGASGTATFTVSTMDDSEEEANGSVTATVESGSGYAAARPLANSAAVAVIDNDSPPPADPVVSISSGPAVTEGEGASFVLTASPAPVADLSVHVTVAENGSFAAPGELGMKQVTVGPSGTATFTVSTTDDSEDEANGSVTATVESGSGYAAASVPANSAAVVVRDNDIPPSTDPVVSITSGPAVTEGGGASFVLTASPAPVADLSVHVTVAENGLFAAPGELGARQVTVDASGTATFTVVTTDDSEDEANGSVTALVASGSGYAVASPPANSAAVAVRDNDNPPPTVVPPPVSSVSVRLSVSPNPVGEDASATVTAMLSAPLDAAVTIPLVLTAGTAEAGDYGALASITIAANEPSGSGVIAMVPDLDTDDETFTVALGGLPTVVAAGSPGSVEVTIADNANVVVAENIPTSAEPDGDELPTAFALDQNYPNPFNPSTTIGFSLAKAQRVALTVYDMLGQEVRVLLDGAHPAGRYRIPFDASDLASGTYLYVLRTEQQTAVRTMALLK